MIKTQDKKLILMKLDISADVINCLRNPQNWKIIKDIFLFIVKIPIFIATWLTVISLFAYGVFLPFAIDEEGLLALATYLVLVVFGFTFLWLISFISKSTVYFSIEFTIWGNYGGILCGLILLTMVPTTT